eukprot:2669257-Prymnesium_polylepis.1
MSPSPRSSSAASEMSSRVVPASSTVHTLSACVAGSNTMEVVCAPSWTVAMGSYPGEKPRSRVCCPWTLISPLWEASLASPNESAISALMPSVSMRNRIDSNAEVFTWVSSCAVAHASCGPDAENRRVPNGQTNQACEGTLSDSE